MKQIPYWGSNNTRPRQKITYTKTRLFTCKPNVTLWCVQLIIVAIVMQRCVFYVSELRVSVSKHRNIENVVVQRHIGEPPKPKSESPPRLSTYTNMPLTWPVWPHLTWQKKIKVFKKHVYNIMSYLDNARRNPPAIRIAPKICRYSLRARMEKHPRSRGSRHCEIDMVCGNPWHYTYQRPSGRYPSIRH